MRLTSFHHHQIKFCARKNHRPAKNTQNGGKKRTQTHLLCCQPKFTPLFIQKGNQNGDLKTGNVSPRTASVRGAWRNPTFCCVYCDLCPRTIAFLSLQILSGKPHGLFPIRRHYNRRFLQCQPLNVKKSRKRPEAPAFSAFRVQSIFCSNQRMMHVAVCVPLASIWLVPSGSVSSQRVPIGTHTVTVKVSAAVSHCTLASP